MFKCVKIPELSSQCSQLGRNIIIICIITVKNDRIIQVWRKISAYNHLQRFLLIDFDGISISLELIYA